ncbi:MAG: zinc ribbon domain-containing protein [Byssovorax sp.]
MKLRALGCPHCGAPISVAWTLCRYCAAPLLARAQLDLEADDRRTVVDFTTGVTPHELTPGRYPEVTIERGIGMRFTLAPGASSRLFAARPFKDGSARVEGLVLDPDAGIEVGLRVTEAGQARMGYLLKVRPALGEITVVRYATLKDAPVYNEVILPWTKARTLRTIGEVNRIELLAADSMLQARINDVIAARLDDPRFGYGVPVYGASSLGQQARVTLRRFEHGMI